MKILLVALACGLTWQLAADIPPPPPPLPSQARELSVDEVATLITQRKDVGVLDVRTAEEFAAGARLPGAKHLDFFREDFAPQLSRLGLDPSKPCVVYCALGGRARRAAVTLAQAGFSDIAVLSGGCRAWKNAGKPTL
ncbi:MAG: rhodanese-like domain-containing protein [Roseimicrobium sp.]